jgi:hypothetical protein
MFIQSLHPRGMTTGAPPQITTPAAPDPGNTPPSPASLSLCRHGYNSSPPLIFMRRLGLRSMTWTLPYTAKYNSSLIVTELYKYSTQYFTNSTLANLPPPWICLARTSVYTRLKSSLPLYQELPKETLLPLQFPTPWLHLQLCTLLFYQTISAKQN